MRLLTFPKQANNILYFYCVYTLFSELHKNKSAVPYSRMGRRTLFILLLFFNASLYALSSSSSRLVMLFKPVTMVEPLCRSAPVAGGRIPPTPSAMSSALKPMIKL